MKNRKLVYGVIIVMLVNFYLFGCSPKILPPDNTAPPVVEETNKPIDWKQDNFDSFPMDTIKKRIHIVMKDTLKFPGRSSVVFDNGKVKEKDSMVVILPGTPGRIVSVKTANKKVVEMNVRYDKDPDYPVTFTVNTDLTYSVKDKPKLKAQWYLEKEPVEKILTGFEVQPQ